MNCGWKRRDGEHSGHCTFPIRNPDLLKGRCPLRTCAARAHGPRHRGGVETLMGDQQKGCALSGVNPVTVVADHMGDAELCEQGSATALLGDAAQKGGHLKGDHGQHASALGVADVCPRLFHAIPRQVACARPHAFCAPAFVMLCCSHAAAAPREATVTCALTSARPNQGPRAGGVSQAPVENGEQDVPLRSAVVAFDEATAHEA